jgi:hypothetical protein
MSAAASHADMPKANSNARNNNKAWTLVVRNPTKLASQSFTIADSSVGRFLGRAGVNVRWIEYEHPAVRVTVARGANEDGTRTVTVSPQLSQERPLAECEAAVAAAVAACKRSLSTASAGSGGGGGGGRQAVSNAGAARQWKPQLRAPYTTRISIGLGGCKEAAHKLRVVVTAEVAGVGGGGVAAAAAAAAAVRPGRRMEGAAVAGRRNGA